MKCWVNDPILRGEQQPPLFLGLPTWPSLFATLAAIAANACGDVVTELVDLYEENYFLGRKSRKAIEALTI